MSSEQVPEVAGDASIPQGSTSAGPAGRLACGPWLGAVAALVGGAIAWTLLQALHPVFTVPEKYAILPAPVPAELSREIEEAAWKAHLGNAMLFLGLIGALLGGSLGAGEGLARRSLGAAALGLGACALVAAVFGAAAGLAGHFIYHFESAAGKESEISTTIFMQAVMMATIGLGVGLAVGTVLGRRLLTIVNCSIAGLLAGVLSGILFPYLASRFLPVATSEIVIPGGDLTRLLWILLTAALVGLIVPGMALSRRGPAGAAASEKPA